MQNAKCKVQNEGKSQKEKGVIKMRRLRNVLLVMMGVMLLGGVAYGAQSADITITVTCQVLSVSVSPNAYDFGVVIPGAITNSASAITVTNDGNVNEKYGLQATDTANWSLVSGVPSTDQFRLLAKFASTRPATYDYSTANDVLTVSKQVCDGTIFATDAANDGYDVASEGVQDLWFRFDAPSDTAITTQQTITVTLTAESM